MKRVDVTLTIIINDDGTVAITAVPQVKTETQPALTENKTTQVTAQPKTTAKNQSSKRTSKKEGESHKDFLIRRIKEIMNENPVVAGYLISNDVNISSLDKLSEKQLKRALALALNYSSQKSQKGKNETSSKKEEEVTEENDLEF